MSRLEGSDTREQCLVVAVIVVSSLTVLSIDSSCSCMAFEERNRELVATQNDWSRKPLRQVRCLALPSGGACYHSWPTGVDANGRYEGAGMC